MEFSAVSFNFQYLLFSLRSSCGYLGLLPHLLIAYILPSIISSVMCFRRQFLCKMWPIQLGFLPCIVCRVFLSSLTVCNSSFLTGLVQQSFLHLCPAPHFKTFWSISDVQSQVSKFKPNTKLYSKRSTSLVSSLHLSQICLRKESSCWLLLFP